MQALYKRARFRSFASALCAAIVCLTCGVAWWNSARADSAAKKELAGRQWAIVKGEFPESDGSFPPGVGAPDDQVDGLAEYLKNINGRE
jgi:hypothetical protein